MTTRHNCLWTALICVLTVSLELWICLAVYLFSSVVDDDDGPLLGPILFLAVGLGLCYDSYLVYIVVKCAHHKLLSSDGDRIRFMNLGDDYFPPFPKWEWGDKPLLWNVVDWDKDSGWEKMLLCPPRKNTNIPVKPDEETAGTLRNAPIVFLTTEGRKKAAQQRCPWNDYERDYLARAADQNRPTAVVCICYLLSEQSNQFLRESLEFFTQIHTAPIYVMINARHEDGDYIQRETRRIENFITRISSQGQIKAYFVPWSRSKADNLNAFIDILPDQHELLENNDKLVAGYKYVINYDVDDRPTFNESSLLSYAEKMVGTKQDGREIVGVQGPCIECYNDTWSGLAEARLEYKTQAHLLAGEGRFVGKVKSQGSNSVVLASVFRRFHFSCKALLEDWRWSNDLIERENLGLAYSRSMVSFGQTPIGWRGVLRRRNRWYKGRWQETFRDAFFRSPFKMKQDYLFAWVNIWAFIFVYPVLYMLIYFGFLRIFNEATKHNSNWFWVLDTERLEEKGIAPLLGFLWNVTWPVNLILLVSNSFVHFLRVNQMHKSSCFLNGRDSRKYRVMHFLLHFGELFDSFLHPFGLYHQYEYYCLVEYCLDAVSFKPVEWVPTPKVAASTIDDSDTFKIDLGSTGLTQQSSAAA